jgi:peptide/nickel transport system substrate-binding protein
MRRIVLLSVALISLVAVANAATRPRYGGTLRVAIQSAPTTFELNSATTPTDYWDVTRMLALVGDTLVNVDALDRPLPALALAWRSDSSARHWEFTLRPGINFHDGSAASAPAIAQILGALHPEWNVRSAGDSLIIETDAPHPSLLAELALPRNLILTRNSSGIPSGTGPFRIVEFEPGKLLKLVASDGYWGGRPFIDTLEIDFGESLRAQALSLELSRADLVEATPQSPSSSSRIRTSLPVELMALVFAPNSKADIHLREALALSIDRKPIQSVLFKGAAEPTGSILPNWMSGYSAAFSTRPNLVRAKTLLADSRPSSLLLSYDPRDPRAQLIAERMALNARDVGITVQVSLSGSADIQLLRVALPSPDAVLSLREAARQLVLPQPSLQGNSVEDLYQAERGLLDGKNVIPLFHLPLAGAVGPRVRGWAPDQLGGWNLPDSWLEDSRLAESRQEDSR